MHSALIPVNSLAGMKVHEEIGHNDSVGDRSQDSACLACSFGSSSQLHPGILSSVRMQRTLDRPCRLCFCQDPPVTSSIKPNTLRGPTLGSSYARIKVKESHGNHGAPCDCVGCVSFQLELICYFPFFPLSFSRKRKLDSCSHADASCWDKNVTHSGCF